MFYVDTSVWKSVGYISANRDRGTVTIMYCNPLTSEKVYMKVDIAEVLDVCIGRKRNSALYVRRK